MKRMPGSTASRLATTGRWCMTWALGAALAAPGASAEPASSPTVDYAVLAKHPLRTLDGETTTLRDHLGEIVVLNFWASWCEPCRREIPALNALDDRLEKQGGRVIAVSIDQDAARARRFAAQHGMTMTVCHDGPSGLVERLDFDRFPFTLVIDANGNVVLTALGASKEETDRIAAVVDGLVSKRAVAERSTSGEEG